MNRPETIEEMKELLWYLYHASPAVKQTTDKCISENYIRSDTRNDG